MAETKRGPKRDTPSGTFYPKGVRAERIAALKASTGVAKLVIANRAMDYGLTAFEGAPGLLIQPATGAAPSK